VTRVRLQLSSLCTSYNDRKHAVSKWVWWSRSRLLSWSFYFEYLPEHTISWHFSRFSTVPPSICRNSTSNRPIPLNPNHFQFIFSSLITLPPPKLRTASTRVLTIPGPSALPLNIIYTPLIFWPYLQWPWLSTCPTSRPFFVAYVVPKDPSKSEAFWYIS
jgi:hypothetical protein